MLYSCDTKFCPLLLAAALANSDRTVQMEVRQRQETCCSEECQFWMNGKCSITVMAEALMKIVNGTKTLQ